MDNQTDNDFFTANELNKHGYTFAELQHLAKIGTVRRRHRVNYRGEDVFTFSESDLAKYRDRTEVTDGNT